MSGVATAVVGGAVIGSVIQSDAARRAASSQSDSAGQAIDQQRYMYDQTRADQQPWRDAGTKALTDLQNPETSRNMTMADFQQDPGYAFRMQQGQQAIERSAAARGGLNSGATLMALNDYGQQSGSQEYQNAFNRFNDNRTYNTNRLASLANLGQVSTSNTSAAGMNASNQIGQNIVGAGNAIAAGQMGQSNAINGAIGTGANTWMNYQMMNRLSPQAGGAAGGGAPINSAGAGYHAFGELA